MYDEILDIVNGHDEVIGTINRKDYGQFIQNNAGFIRASELFIMNDKGELWTPIRTARKTIAPNGYDYGAAGHVGSGEGYLDTIIRETQEEVNLTITPADVEFVAKLKSTTTKYIRCIYLLRTNTSPDFNPDDFVGAEWMSPANLLAELAAGHPAKSSLRPTIVTLQAYLTE